MPVSAIDRPEPLFVDPGLPDLGWSEHPQVPWLHAGDDFRAPHLRRAVFLAFYAHQLRYEAHPGGVYRTARGLADLRGWGPEELHWWAILNGHTQHPPMTELLLRAAPTADRWEAAVDWWETHVDELRVDTDRRHQKRRLGAVLDHWWRMTGGDPVGFWGYAAETGQTWEAARSIPTFGRLSAWSYLDYLAIAGVRADPPDLMLRDLPGSASHRSGLARVLGRDDLDWHRRNPLVRSMPPDLVYGPRTLDWLEAEAARLLDDARIVIDHPDVGTLTLESALCTFKSWSRPNRRYPGVYLDLAAERIRDTEHRLGVDLADLWTVREALPEWMRVECRPSDPGAVPLKQNWYLRTGQVIGMREYPWAENDLDPSLDRPETR